VTNFFSSDYIYVLDHCLKQNTPYIAILEDYIIAADGWLAKSLVGLPSLNALTEAQNESDKCCLYMRLFSTEKSLMWTNADFWYRNMPLAFVLTTSVAFFLLSITKRSY
jgi:hypothetical protein